MKPDSASDLVAAFHLFHHFGMDDLVSTHLSMRDPGYHNKYLVNRRAVTFQHITEPDLRSVEIDARKIDTNDILETAHEIHAPIYRARDNARCVMHLHPPYGSIFSITGQKLLMLHQFSLHFAGERIAYVPYDGLITDSAGGDMLVRAIKNANAAILQNHGLLTIASSVREAFNLMYYLEQACRIQLEATKVSQNLLIVPDPVAQRAARQLESPSESISDEEWQAITRIVR